AVHDLRSRPGPGDGLAPAGPATRVTKLAAAAAAGVRDAGDRAGAGLLRSPGQRGDRTRIRRVHGPLPAAAALARRRMDRRRTWRDVEPPLVPRLRVGLQRAAAGTCAAARLG